MKWVETVIAFAGLIIFHEFGHFLLARLSGMKVERFSVGFGPVLLKKQVGDVEYALCALPLGGYVKIAGMDPSEEGIETDPRAYNNRPVWQRLLVIFAGPAFNYILAAGLFTTVFLLGAPVPNLSTSTVGEVSPGAPAAKAGLQHGDKIVSVDGKPVRNWDDLRKAISPHAGQATTIGIERGGKKLTVSITPKAVSEKTADGKTRTVGQIGVQVSSKQIAGLPFGKAVIQGAEQTWHTNLNLIAGVAALFKGSPDAHLQGPVAIIKATSDFAERGIVPLLWLVAVISVDLGLLNLLPIPALDGGRLVFLGIEVVRRKPVDAQVELAVHAVGFLLLIGLMILVTFGDVKHIFFGS